MFGCRVDGGLLHSVSDLKGTERPLGPPSWDGSPPLVSLSGVLLPGLAGLLVLNK